MKKTQVLQLFLVIFLTILSNPAFSQLHRNFPIDSKLGNLTAVSFPLFTINEQQMQMGAGGQIRGVDNLIILPNVANYTGLVRYQLDIMGNLHRVWFLTPEEANHAEQEELHKPK
jgi:hypothetical protein